MISQGNKFLFSTLFFVLLLPGFGITQTMNFLSGYSYSIPQFDHLNEAFALSEELYDWDIRSFKEIKNMHGVLFGLRYRTDGGFFGLTWEQKMKSIKGERSTEGRDRTERWSLSHHSFSAESALTVGPFSIGAGLSTNLFNVKLDASFNQKTIKLLKDQSYGTHFFMEFALGKPSNIQLTLRPFYHLDLSDLNYKNLTYLISGLTPGTKESQNMWGFTLLIVNGPK